MDGTMTRPDDADGRTRRNVLGATVSLAAIRLTVRAPTTAPVAVPGPSSTLAGLAVALNVVLLALLGTVWAPTDWRLRSKHTLGFVVFAVLLFAESAFAFYFYSCHDVRSARFSTAVPDVAWQATLLFHVFETLAIVFLTWVTLE